MCGIAGTVSLDGPLPIEEDLLRRMASLLGHRGPDESGLYLDPCAGLAHARLSIIGLEGGAQPIGNEDGTLWIVYNGEVFNYIELRQELRSKGHRFSTETDTEVVLHLYEELGPGCVERLNGQFAFAIWDARKRELFLARDRVGIRPLFFTQQADRLLFASEIKALFLDEGVERALDPVSLVQVLTFWSTLSGRTPFKGISELPPGHWLMLRNGSVTQRRYWDVPVGDDGDRWTGSLDEAVDALEELFVDAVRLRLRADVPVGAYLSGGLDSSLTTAIIAKHFNNRLRTFSVRFEEARFDETPYQQELVRHLGTDHSEVLFRNGDFHTWVDDVVWHCETPLLRSGPVPLFRLSQLVRERGFKVVVAGEGADEVFGGYNIFKEAKVRRFWARQPASTWRPRLLERLYPYVFDDPARARHVLQRFYAVAPGDLADPLFSHRVRWKNSGRNTMFLADPVRDGLAGYDPLEEVASRLGASFASRTPLGQAQTLEMDVFLANYLLSSQGDRVGMAHSVEGRVPFLDHRVIAFAFGLPDLWKIRGLDEKHIVKRLARRYLPPSITDRPKQPYRAPIREAVAAGPGYDHLERVLGDGSLSQAGLFDADKVRLLRRRLKEGKAMSEAQGQAVMGILTTQLLHDRFVEHFPRDVPPREPARAIRRLEP